MFPTELLHKFKKGAPIKIADISLKMRPASL